MMNILISILLVKHGIIKQQRLPGGSKTQSWGIKTPI
jgi:hypothetical protein